MTLATRSVTSVSWNIGASLIKVAILFGRAIVLARLLPVETFGVYALAWSIVTLSSIVPGFGLLGAFLHRAPETEDEDAAAANLLSLRGVLTAGWAIALLLGSVLFAEGELRTALICLTLVYAGFQLTDPARYVLTRRVVHRRLALIDIAITLMATLVALLLAFRGASLWALLATDVVALAVTALGLYLWQPVWKPRLAWSANVIRYYLRFGSRTFVLSGLTEALDNIDEIWTGFYLGNTALGYYSRAFTFATYPRRLLAMPVGAVAGGTFSELKGDRLRLSQAFFRVNALLVRSGFLLGGLTVLVAPEFVRLALGEKWTPMIRALQLMLVFALFDPIKSTVSSLFVAVGRPEQVISVRLLQLAVLIAGLYLLGRPWGIEGVAVAVDIMLVTGLALLLVWAGRYVDFSKRRLFAVPGAALVVGGLAALGAQRAAAALPVCGDASDFCSSDWFTGCLKGIAFLLGYALVLLALERRELGEFSRFVRARLAPAAELPAAAHQADSPLP